MAKKKLPIIAELIDELNNIISEASTDAKSFDGGKKAPGTRVRKAMQAAKKKAQEIRIAVMVVMKTR